MPYKQSSNPLSRKTSPLRRSPFKNTDPQFENSVSDDEHFRLSSNNDAHSVMVLAPGEENKSTTFDRDFDAAIYDLWAESYPESFLPGHFFSSLLIFLFAPLFRKSKNSRRI